MWGHARRKLIAFPFLIIIKEIETIMNTIPSMGVFVGDCKISVLIYADDLVLCSVTSDGLQAGVNALHELCMINHLTVNTAKSKVMYISRTNKRNLPVIYYNEKPLEWVEDFKYLGVPFAKNGKLTKGLKTFVNRLHKHKRHWIYISLSIHLCQYSTSLNYLIV